jgi:hypothetical protein
VLARRCSKTRAIAIADRDFARREGFWTETKVLILRCRNDDGLKIPYLIDGIFGSLPGRAMTSI